MKPKSYFNKAIEAGISGHVKSYLHHLAGFDAREEQYKAAMEKLELSYRLFEDAESLFTLVPMQKAGTETNKKP